MSNKRVLTGMRTTGPLHLGHYVGALSNWVKVQDSGEYECFFLLADYQALTTHSDHPEMLEVAIRQAVLDWMSVGIDPFQSNVHIVQQSQVLGRYELSALLAQKAPFNLVMQNPTLKSEKKKLSSVSLAFINYPLDQVGDIQMIDPMTVGGKILVPVGKDQVPHLEFARDMVRIMNRDYLKGEAKLTECEALVGDIGRLVGTDGDEKMSKSLGNTIMLTDTPEQVRNIIKRMVSGSNDNSRFNRRDKSGKKTLFGNPTFISLAENYLDDSQFEKFRYLVVNPVMEYVLAFMQPHEAIDILEQYYEGKIRYSDTKSRLVDVINNLLDPIRDKRQEIENMDIYDIVFEGSQRASDLCQPVVNSIRESMHLRIPR